MTTGDLLTPAASEGGPNIRALIHEYIMEMQPPKASLWRALTTPIGQESSEVEILDFTRAQQRLVHMSRIRRMCRLLVDYDSSLVKKEEPEETEEGKVEEKEEALVDTLLVNMGTGTIAMAKCWRDIVQTEVTSVLKKFDYGESPHTIAVNILSIYDQLKQAMFELFGGHSQFALALKEGFSKAFQSLDEVTGVRVS